jgi:HD-GYP domain-containing protein (c-di-GMP phosphodiesterase class II)
MIFKIAQHMGLGEYKSMLYFCAAMVYDIGFLNIDSSLLDETTLTEEQKYIIRSHVNEGTKNLDFVPEKFKPVFAEAITMHHENLDGSGYPTGLKSDEIPAIARMIRLVESFIAQVSKRNYRGIFDKETAIEELRKHPEWYDLEMLDILDKMI